ncbi:MAG: hypothetical protein ACK4PR_01565 [Gammaproteobacteria bacterium]
MEPQSPDIEMGRYERGDLPVNDRYQNQHDYKDELSKHINELIRNEDSYNKNYPRITTFKAANKQSGLNNIENKLRCPIASLGCLWGLYNLALISVAIGGAIKVSCTPDPGSNTDNITLIYYEMHHPTCVVNPDPFDLNDWINMAIATLVGNIFLFFCCIGIAGFVPIMSDVFVKYEKWSAKREDQRQADVFNQTKNKIETEVNRIAKHAPFFKAQVFKRVDTQQLNTRNIQSSIKMIAAELKQQQENLLPQSNSKFFPKLSSSNEIVKQPSKSNLDANTPLLGKTQNI